MSCFSLGAVWLLGALAWPAERSSPVYLPPRERWPPPASSRTATVPTSPVHLPYISRVSPVYLQSTHCSHGGALFTLTIHAHYSLLTHYPLTTPSLIPHYSLFNHYSLFTHYSLLTHYIQSLSAAHSLSTHCSLAHYSLAIVVTQ